MIGDRTRILAALALCGVLVAGCKSGPDYQRPEMQPPAALRGSH